VWRYGTRYTPTPGRATANTPPALSEALLTACRACPCRSSTDTRAWSVGGGNTVPWRLGIASVSIETTSGTRARTALVWAPAVVSLACAA
jgi:hypothetical protein